MTLPLHSYHLYKGVCIPYLIEAFLSIEETPTSKCYSRVCTCYTHYLQSYTHLPPFCLTVDTTSSYYYNADPFITELLRIETELTELTTNFLWKILLMLRPKFVTFHHSYFIMVSFLHELMWPPYWQTCRWTGLLISF